MITNVTPEEIAALKARLSKRQEERKIEMQMEQVANMVQKNRQPEAEEIIPEVVEDEPERQETFIQGLLSILVVVFAATFWNITQLPMFLFIFVYFCVDAYKSIKMDSIWDEQKMEWLQWK